MFNKLEIESNMAVIIYYISSKLYNKHNNYLNFKSQS